MASELNLVTALDRFVLDIEAGKMPQIYELMESDQEATAELLPLLELITLIEASKVEMPEEQGEETLQQLLEVFEAANIERAWSIQRLIAEGDPETVAASATLGLTTDQVAMMRTDATPLDVSDPNQVNQVVDELSRKYSLPRFDLLVWVRQLISSVLPVGTQNPAMIYTRKGKREKGNPDRS